MKTLLALAAATSLSFATAAPALAGPPPPANLAVFSENGQPFSLVLDGHLLTRVGVPQVRVGWLAPGRHYADISLPTPYGPPMSFRTVVWLQPGRESSYVLVVRRWGPQLQQVDAAPPYPGGYPAPAAPIGGYGAPATPPTGGYDPSGNYPAPSGGYDPNGGYPAPATPNGGYTPGSPAGSYPAPGGYPGSSNGYYNGPALHPLSAAELANLTQAVRRASFDSDKLSVARQGLQQSSIRSEELAGLVKVMSFGDARVELATFGYAHVSDPQNFYQVYGALPFSSEVQRVRQALGL